MDTHCIFYSIFNKYTKTKRKNAINKVNGFFCACVSLNIMKKVLHRINYLVLMSNMAALFDTPLQHLKTRRVVNSCWSNT